MIGVVLLVLNWTGKDSFGLGYKCLPQAKQHLQPFFGRSKVCFIFARRACMWFANCLNSLWSDSMDLSGEIDRQNAPPCCIRHAYKHNRDLLSNIHGGYGYIHARFESQLVHSSTSVIRHYPPPPTPTAQPERINQSGTSDVIRHSAAALVTGDSHFLGDHFRNSLRHAGIPPLVDLSRATKMKRDLFCDAHELWFRRKSNDLKRSHLFHSCRGANFLLRCRNAPVFVLVSSRFRPFSTNLFSCSSFAIQRRCQGVS